MSYQLTRKEQLQQLVVHSLGLKSKSSTSPATPQKNPVTRSSGYTVARIHLATSAGIDWLIDVSRTAIYWNKGPSNGLIEFDAKITAAR
jgi:hypothetical protein